MLNQSLFENYLSMRSYYDDDFEKTAAFADFASLDDVHDSYVRRTQDYSMLSFSYLPSACCKVRAV